MGDSGCRAVEIHISIDYMEVKTWKNMQYGKIIR